MMLKTLAILTFPLLISGCELMDELTGENLKREQVKNSQAIGSACRQAGRNIETCYEINPKAIKSAIVEGWKEMDVYMRDNKLAVQPTEKLPNKDSQESVVSEEKLASLQKTAKEEIKKPNLKLELEKNN